ncbi:hypothetical protein ACOSQ2_029674 [Xanthoceras sorbifolium]|uniref:SHSP domain-containing protein n=1 Tax=Xanthoceras sorbifolium TaxID=99658 RepID=A0ABQ8HB94_9ROSI|nr:hypothetical protein JRO89_XS12G0054200 [Xanthoceras sorbifolium]
MSLISGKRFHGTPRNVGYNHVSPYHHEAFDSPAAFHQVHYQQFTAPHHGFSPPPMVNASRIEWSETPVEHMFKTELPGFNRSEVKVEVEDGRILRISGEKNVEREDKSDMFHRVERSSGKFVRCFQLPENIKFDRMKAHLEDGVLTVKVPKEHLENKKHHARTISITGK